MSPTKIETTTVDIKPILASKRIVRAIAPTVTGTRYSDNSK